MSNADCNQDFEQWARDKQLISESYGIRSEWSHLPLLREAFELGRNNLQAAKPEQAQTAVVLPEPVAYCGENSIRELVNFTTTKAINRMWQKPLYDEYQMESYATANLAEAEKDAEIARRMDWKRKLL